MQIFVLDKSINKIAEYLDDKRLIKSILETAQILCTCHWTNNSKAPYKKTHEKHPCIKWCCESNKNYNWLCNLGLILCKEYTYRFNKIHKTKEVIEWCIINNPKLPNKKITSFVQAIPDKYKSENPVFSYRAYYNAEKLNKNNKWTKRNVPYWVVMK